MEWSAREEHIRLCFMDDFMPSLVSVYYISALCPTVPCTQNK